MNKLINFCLFISISMLISCGDSMDETPEQPSSDFHFTLTIDGTEYTTANSLISVNPDLAGGIFNITGTDLDGTSSWVVITLNSPTKEGTFTVAEENVSMSYLTGISVWGASSQESTGTVTISNNTSEFMEGNFSFTGTNQVDGTTREITAGTFKARKI